MAIFTIRGDAFLHLIAGVVSVDASCWSLGIMNLSIAIMNWVCGIGLN